MPRDLAERLGRFAGLRGHAVRTLPVRAGALGQRGESLGPLVEETHHIPGEGFHLIGVDLLNPGLSRVFYCSPASICPCFNPQFTLLQPPSDNRLGALRGFCARGHCAMQYSKCRTIANRHGEPTRTPLQISCCARFLALPCACSALLLPLGLGACADTISSNEVTPLEPAPQGL